MTGGPMGAVGLAKRNLCTGERSGLYEPNTYPSEADSEIVMVDLGFGDDFF